jgi:hypothetical protein
MKSRTLPHLELGRLAEVTGGQARGRRYDAVPVSPVVVRDIRDNTSRPMSHGDVLRADEVCRKWAGDGSNAVSRMWRGALCDIQFSQQIYPHWGTPR